MDYACKKGVGLIRNFIIENHKLLLEIAWDDINHTIETLLIDTWAIHWHPDPQPAVKE